MSDKVVKNIWLFLQPAAQAHPNAVAWIDWSGKQRRVISYQQLYDAALTTAARLRQLGIAQHDSVAIIAPNGAEFTIAALAAWKIGANVAPIHFANSEYDIAKQLQALAPKILLKHHSTATYPNTLDISMRREVGNEHSEANLPAQFHSGQLAARIYTSGSTGNPKIVRLSHGNLISNVLASSRIKNFTTRDRFISLLPYSHAMGMMGNLLLPLYHGAAIAAPRTLAANEILATLQKENISVVIAVPKLYRNIMLGLEKKFSAGGVLLAAYRGLLRVTPPMLRQYINAPLRKKLAAKVKVWVSGGSHLDPRISKYYHDLGLPLRQGYGLTETSPLTCLQGEFDKAHGSVGKAVEKVRVKIHNPNREGSGEVWIKGVNVMLGYEDAQQTAEVLQDGWFKSGDIGRLDSAGRLFLTGRAKRLIVTEVGKNVYPEELEIRLERDAKIKEVCVLEMDMKPVCVLAMSTDIITGTSTCIKTNKAKYQQAVMHARNALSEFNSVASAHDRITRFAIVDELPRTPLGKIALAELPSIFIANEVA